MEVNKWGAAATAGEAPGKSPAPQHPRTRAPPGGWRHFYSPSIFAHGLWHPNAGTPQRRCAVVLPQWQGACTTHGHGGHGPGWHSSLHACAQRASGFSQRSPHVCGASQGSNGGSTCLVQKHR